jgi:hypothetical protein
MQLQHRQTNQTAHSIAYVETNTHICALADKKSIRKTINPLTNGGANFKNCSSPDKTTIQKTKYCTDTTDNSQANKTADNGSHLEAHFTANSNHFSADSEADLEANSTDERSANSKTNSTANRHASIATYSTANGIANLETHSKTNFEAHSTANRDANSKTNFTAYSNANFKALFSAYTNADIKAHRTADCKANFCKVEAHSVTNLKAHFSAYNKTNFEAHSTANCYAIFETHSGSDQPAFPSAVFCAITFADQQHHYG